MTVTVAEKATLTGKTCYDAVAYCLFLDGQVTQAQYNGWGNSTANALLRLVNTADPLAINPNIPPDHIVGIFRRTAAAGGLTFLSHVMISLGNGLCIGTNNGCIGGTGDWSVHDLSVRLMWPGGANPSLNLDPAAPPWARERAIHHRALAAAVALF